MDILMANKQQYAMAQTESLSHVKFCKLRYFGHAMRIPDSIDSSAMVGPCGKHYSIVRARPGI